ncbi:FadR/GntR family transcriptional regulator [Streptomyces rhizosphaericus]|uniref:GntR family transcriptional regulator n=1 Tax=Streptomyces rhizosphaericus TaxID=114699 RepID=A0A6G4ATN1_9ACTN|nr:GntR family transcriptional regulator [Streptomyces rhizosphaericus]NEW76608.1 GntR family transcriptional regulator [Streptomyces rhizosphaericus]
MTATDEAADGLRAMIANGELTPGQQLPAESELCARLGVSRGSLREVQKRLAVAEDEAERHALDREFHSALCEASGNEALAALADVLRARGSHYSIYGAAEADTIRLAGDLGHEALINAMAARDPAATAAAATAHLSQTEAWLRRYAPLPDGPAAG